MMTAQPPRPVPRIRVTRAQAEHNRAQLEHEVTAWQADVHAQGLKVEPLVKRRKRWLT